MTLPGLPLATTSEDGVAVCLPASGRTGKATKRRVLFISHDASRTGAPLILINFLRWLKEQGDIPFEILVRNGGPLMSEFSRLARTQIIPNASTWQPLYDPAEIGLIYSNTVTNHDILERLRYLNCPVLTHAHELDFQIRHVTGLEYFQRTLEHTTRFIACSRAVAVNLTNNYQVPGERIDIVHEFIPTQRFSPPTADGAEQRQHRESLGLPHDVPIVIGCGTADWRKGADLFIAVARAVKSAVDAGGKDIMPRFLWLGYAWSRRTRAQLQYDVPRAGLQEHLQFVGSVPNPGDYLRAANLFALTSREDPYPLVMLEAAATGLPIVCFAGSGGCEEFIEGDAGIAVPYLDISAMAQAILGLLRDPQRSRQLGQVGATRVRERHDLAKGALQVHEIIARHLLPDEPDSSLVTQLTVQKRRLQREVELLKWRLAKARKPGLLSHLERGVRAVVRRMRG